MPETQDDPETPGDIPNQPDIPNIPDEDLPEGAGWSDAPIAGGRIDLHEGPIVAGDPDGARVEVTETGLRAYDATGTETASIAGEGGEFVGGEFRTSDTLPGRVTLADDAYVSSYDGVARPGISVEPEDATRYSILPGVGPESVGMTIDGGKLTTGEFSYITMFPNAATIRSHRSDGTIGGEVAARPDGSLLRTYREDGTAGGAIQTTPTASLMRTYREDGTTGGVIQATPTASTMRTYSGNSSEQGWVQVRPQDAELAYVAPDNTYFSRIKADANEAFLYTRAGGTNRYLSVDADGIWVKTNKSGSWESWNLEETANDSGWISLSLPSGISGTGNPAYRVKNNVVYLRGTLTRSGSWSSGWNQLTSYIPSEHRPTYNALRGGVSSTADKMLLQVTGAGRFEMFLDKSYSGSMTVQLSPMFYPIG